MAIVEIGGKSIDRQTLERRVYALSNHLRTQGLQKGDRVLIQIPPGIELTVTILAVLWLGGVVVLLEGGVGDQIYTTRVTQLAPQWILIHSKLVWIHRLPGVRSLLSYFDITVPPWPTIEDCTSLTLTSSQLSLESEAIPAEVMLPEDEAIVVFTGGTTSAPKCVQFSCSALEHFLNHIHLAIGHCDITHFLADTPPQALYAIKMGYTAYINKGRKLKRAQSMLKLIQTGQIDACFTSPYLWMELFKAGEVDALPDNLRTIMLGSAPVTKSFLQKLDAVTADNTRILCIYGMTEVGGIAFIEATDKLQWNEQGDLVGEVLESISVDISTSSKESNIGEIIVHSPSLYTGYFGHPPRKQNEGLSTGDLGRWVEFKGRQMLVLEGRIKDMIIRDGFNIYPQTFEGPLTEHFNRVAQMDLIRQTALVGVWNAIKEDEDVILFVEWAGTHSKDASWLKEQALEICGQQVLPDQCIGLKTFPVTGRQNKLDKKALRALVEDAPSGSKQ
jgi:acyl-CoA synthetase (AMP-forming)/AMP-acid ligase II